MNKSASLLGALGVGAGLMYLLDPDRGKRRRALMRDRALHLNNEARRQLEKNRRDLRNRTRGIIAEAESLVAGERISDKQLEARVRTRLGRLSSHPHAIKTEVREGRVRLSGPILADEIDTLLCRVGRMTGVREVENALEPHAAGEKIPALSPNHKTVARNGKVHTWRKPNLTPLWRVLSVTTGLGCAVYAAKNRGLVGTAVGAAGTELLSLGLANNFLENLGTNGGKGIVVQKAINIAAPPEKVFEICSRPENFPQFMSHVREVRRLGEKQFQWTVDGVAGMPLVWKTEVTEARPNEIIKWRNVGGESVEQTGAMRFERTPENKTRLHVEMLYHPPGGFLAHAVASVFRRDPKSEMDDDLVRMKTFIERGKAPRDAAAAAPTTTAVAAAAQI